MPVWLFALLFAIQAHAGNFDSHYASICSSNDCPASVGVLAFHDPTAGDGTHLCSATLISHDEILTNLHCIPTIAREVGASCAENVEFLLPATLGLDAQRVPCARVERFSETSPFGEHQDIPDWAILKLARHVNREVAHLASTGIELNTHLHAYLPMSADVGLAPIVELQKVDCESGELGYLHPLSFHPNSPLFYVHHCNQMIVPGNSGSGFFNVQGDYVGLLSMSELQRGQSFEALREEGAPAGLGTKALCIPISGSVPASCAQKRDDEDSNSAASAFSLMHAYSVEALQDPPHLESANFHFAEAQSEAELVQVFESFYPDVGYADARQYFLDHAMIEPLRDLDRFAREILPRVPICVRKNRKLLSMPFKIFTIRDATLDPDPKQGLFVKTADDMTLLTPSLQTNIPVQIASENLQTARVTFDQVESFWTAAEESAYLRCANSNPKPGGCSEIYSKKAFATYLKAFTLKLPICSDLEAAN